MRLRLTDGLPPLPSQQYARAARLDDTYPLHRGPFTAEPKTNVFLQDIAAVVTEIIWLVDAGGEDASW